MAGPACYKNWRLQIGKSEHQAGYEAPIFTDARILGMVRDGFGPYQFLNAVPMQDAEGVARPALVLRVDLFGPVAPPDWEKTEEAGYHGGTLDDELAAVVSLCLGVRAQAGDRTREFHKDDTRGLPCGIRLRADPMLPRFHGRGVIPSAVGSHNLDLLQPFKDFANLDPAAAETVVRSARLFQQGLWVAQADQNQAWMLFSSAIETAANYWRAADAPAVERVRAWKPTLADAIEQLGGAEFFAGIAPILAPLTGATKKFLDFLAEFCPEPPPTRPPDAYQLDWSPRARKAAFGRIYEYRSRGLHAGVPFPAPMGWAPMRVGNAFAEKLPGGAGTGVHAWQADDIPLLLHTYEYVVRSSLLNWWRTLPRNAEAAPALT